MTCLAIVLLEPCTHNRLVYIIFNIHILRRYFQVISYTLKLSDIYFLLCEKEKNPSLHLVVTDFFYIYHSKSASNQSMNNASFKKICFFLNTGRSSSARWRNNITYFLMEHVTLLWNLLLSRRMLVVCLHEQNSTAQWHVIRHEFPKHGGYGEWIATPLLRFLF